MKLNASIRPAAVVVHNRNSPPTLDCATVLPDAGSPRFNQRDLIEDALTSVEAKRLAELEQDIEGGQQAYVKTGIALAEIRDKRLYRPKFKTFEKYCWEKWGYKRAYAYKLIDAAAIASEMFTMADERDLHVLSRALTDKIHRHDGRTCNRLLQ